MTPVGSNAKPEVLIARKRIIALVAVPLLVFRRSSSIIAFRPKGVAAFPKPSRLEDIFKIIAPIAG